MLNFYNNILYSNFITNSFTLFWFSIFGFIFFYKNLLISLIFMETVLLSLNMLFILFSIYLDDLIGQLFSLMIFIMAAAESVIGSLLIYIYNKHNTNILLINFNNLQG